MARPVIPNGYILVPRAEHPIDNMPSIYRDVWMYILKKARHKEDKTKGFKRGECLISIPELQEALTHYVGYKKVSPTKHQIDNVIRWLRKTNTYDALYDNGYDANTKMITTTRTTRGMIVEVGGYAFFQNPKNYEYDSGYDNENDTSTKRVRQQSDTIHKNVKNVKNDKNVVVVNEDFKSVFNMYQKNIEFNPSPTTTTKLSDDFDLFGKEIMEYAIEKSALLNNHDYRFINYLLKEWRKNQLTSIEAVKQFEDRKQNTNKTQKNNNQEYQNKYPDQPELSFSNLTMKMDRVGYDGLTEREQKAIESYY